jgi:hypothetical protein
MADKGPYPYAIVTTKNPGWARSSHFRRRVNFNNVDHARNYSRKAIAPDWFHRPEGRWKNINNVVKVTVWLAPDEGFTWEKNRGWRPSR